MSTPRTLIDRSSRSRLTRAVIDAWRAGDDAEVARQLRLRPWECGPANTVEDRARWPSVDDDRWLELTQIRRDLEAADEKLTAEEDLAVGCAQPVDPEPEIAE